MEHINEITAEDIKLAERMNDARQKGMYFESSSVTKLYNKLYSTNLANTNCGSCIRKRIDGIWKKVLEIKAMSETIIKEETKQEDGTKSIDKDSPRIDGGTNKEPKTKKANAKKAKLN